MKCRRRKALSLHAGIVFAGGGGRLKEIGELILVKAMLHYPLAIQVQDWNVVLG